MWSNCVLSFSYKETSYILQQTWLSVICNLGFGSSLPCLLDTEGYPFASMANALGVPTGVSWQRRVPGMSCSDAQDRHYFGWVWFRKPDLHPSQHFLVSTTYSYIFCSRHPILMWVTCGIKAFKNIIRRTIASHLLCAQGSQVVRVKCAWHEHVC